MQRAGGGPGRGYGREQAVVWRGLMWSGGVGHAKNGRATEAEGVQERLDVDETGGGELGGKQYGGTYYVGRSEQTPNGGTQTEEDPGAQKAKIASGKEQARAQCAVLAPSVSLCVSTRTPRLLPTLRISLPSSASSQFINWLVPGAASPPAGGS